MNISSALGGALDRALTWLERDLAARSWDWPVALLTLALVQLSSARLSITEWVPSLAVTQSISLMAVVLGILLGCSLFGRMAVLRIAFLYGLFLIPMQLLTVTERSGSYARDLKEFTLRLLYALDLFIRNQPIDDTLFFIMLTSLGFWLVGAYAGYRAVHGRDYLDAVLPPGLVILIVQVYDPLPAYRGWGIGIYMFLALALLGRMYFLENRTAWRRRRVFLSTDTGWDFSRSVVLTAAIAVLIAWNLPGTLARMESAARSWREIVRPITDRLSNAISALDSPYGSSPTGDFYGSDLRLGRNAPLNDTPVFFVEVEDTDIDILRYYWRGRVYDRYENGAWSNTGTLQQDFDPEDGTLLIADEPGRSKLTFTITMNFPKQELLYAPAEMTWVDREGRLLEYPIQGEAGELAAWFAGPALLAGERYQVEALIAYPTVQDLRQAGTRYPPWVIERYLQVPPQVEPQLRQLAERLTAAYTTPYDKTQAITAFLRREIEYQTRILETPPEGLDPVLWMLFDLKKGFCIYYSSAEVLMLRTLGIPARMAVGFAQGVYDEAQDRYRVTRKDSHAWPEVYFPGIGWVEFEPTAGQDRLIRPEEQPQIESGPQEEAGLQGNPPPESLGELEDPPGGPARPGDPSPTEAAASAGTYLVPALVLALLLGGMFFARHYSLAERLPVYLVDRIRRSGGSPPRLLIDWARWAGLLPIERAFHVVTLSLRWLGQAPVAHQTPKERADSLIRALPGAREAIATLAREYQAALFTPRPASIARARSAGARILLEALRARLFRSRQKPKQRYN